MSSSHTVDVAWCQKVVMILEDIEGTIKEGVMFNVLDRGHENRDTRN